MNQEYGVHGGKHLSFDLFRPDSKTALPLVVMLHGGGWISGERQEYHEEAQWLSKHGFACACIDYRLAPLFNYPDPVVDVRNFIRYAKQNADELGIDPNRIAAIGNSAGGYLALMAGVCSECYLGDTVCDYRVQKVIDICGITTFEQPNDSHFPIALSFVEQFLGCGHYENDARWRDASPINHVSSDDPPTLVIHGTADEIVPIDQSRQLVARMKEAGVKVDYHELEGEGHSFTWPAWQKIRELYLAWLQDL